MKSRFHPESTLYDYSKAKRVKICRFISRKSPMTTKLPAVMRQMDATEVLEELAKGTGKYNRYMAKIAELKAAADN